MISLQVAKDTAGPAVVLSFAIAGDLGFWNQWIIKWLIILESVKFKWSKSQFQALPRFSLQSVTLNLAPVFPFAGQVFKYKRSLSFFWYKRWLFLTLKLLCQVCICVQLCCCWRICRFCNRLEFASRICYRWPKTPSFNINKLMLEFESMIHDTWYTFITAKCKGQ